MCHPVPSPPPGNTEAKLLLFLALFAAVLGLVVLLFKRASTAVVATTYTLPFLLLLAVTIAFKLFRKGTATVSGAPVAIGLIFIAGGAIFDMVATVVHTPDLRSEGNPVARALLDSGHRVSTVYVYAIIAQSLAVALIMLFWLSFIRHCRLLIESLNSPQDVKNFIKAATGGAQLTWRKRLSNC